MLNRFLRNIELWLSAAGLLVVWVASIIVSPGDANVWKVAALTALVVSLLHGLIFWIVRHRQRQVRRQAINEIKEMLADVVKNQLAVIGMWLQLGETRPEFEAQLAGISESIGNISEMVDSLSEESLHSWMVKYSQAVEGATELGSVRIAA